MLDATAKAVLLVAVVVLIAAAGRRVAAQLPLLLIVTGALLGAIPGFPRIAPDPELALVIFLPPLVYEGAATSPWHAVRANLRPIVLHAVGLVIVTALALAALARVLVPAFTWPQALLLGAIVAPTDETAALAIFERLRVPQRVAVILIGEGLMSDTTALTLFRLAVAAVAGATLSLWRGASVFAAVFAAELIYGLALGWVVVRLRRRLADARLETIVMLLTPFLAYMPPLYLGGSGVLATAVTGLYVGRMSPRLVPFATRLRILSILDVLTLVLTGVLYLLAGIEIPQLLGSSTDLGLARLLEIGLVLSAALLAVRVVWVTAVAYVPRRLSAALRSRDPMPPLGGLFVIAWAGIRGSVSLAAALALPLTVAAGSELPHRQTIIDLTVCMVVLSLVGQGLSLPWVIRRLGIATHAAREAQSHDAQETKARLLAAEAALKRIDSVAAERHLPAPVVEPPRLYYELERFELEREARMGSQKAHRRQELAKLLEREAFDAERAAILAANDRGEIDDEVLRRVQRSIDLRQLEALLD